VARNFLAAGLLLAAAAPAHSQQPPPRPILDRFYGNIQLTNNGISLVPTFSLGDPALLFDLKLVKGRHSFEPDMRFALEGKPWAFIFWYRYQAVNSGKFSLRVGAHPAINFRTVSVVKDGEQAEVIQARRYLAAEIAPSYALGEHVKVGMYYLTAVGFDEGTKRTHFLTLNAGFSDIPLGKKLYASVSPQVYYLRMDQDDGLYANATLSLAIRNFPLSIGTILNQEITSRIDTDAFNWNLSLIYSF
jgi:hypothetical protein